MIGLSRDANRLAWSDRVERFQTSGLNVAQFCQAEGVSSASFYFWRRKLRAETVASQATLPRFVPVSLPQAPAAQPTAVMSVELPGGVRVRLEINSSDAAES